MKIGVRMSRSFLRTIGAAEFIDWAADIGLASVDLLEADEELASALKSRGLELGSVDSAGRGDLLSPDPAKQQLGVAAARERIAETAKLGGSVLFEVLAPPDPNQSRSDSFAIWKEVYPEVVRAAEEHGVKIAVEPWPGAAPSYPNLGTNPDMLRRMFEAIPSPSFGICYDPSHYVRLGIDPVRLLEEFHDRVHWVHAKDCKLLIEGMYVYGHLGETFGRRFRNGGGSWRYCIPGRGDVDWADVIFHLKALGYFGVISIELEDHQYGDDGEAQKRGIELSRDFLAALL